MARLDVVDAFSRQVGASRDAGSPLAAEFFQACVEDLESGGVLATLVEDWEGQPILDALPQRVMGAVQGLVLDGTATELIPFHPFAGGAPRMPDAARAFIATIAAHPERVRTRLDEQVQTNEVRRCTALIGGFLEVARETGLPLRLLEIGTSAGLNLFWDRYRYELGSHRWGDADSPVILDCDWRGPPPTLSAPVRVASRAGCDLSPLDVSDPEQLRRIESFLWADQSDRRRILRGAAAALGGLPAPIEKLDAVVFLERELAERCQGVATVLFHSSMWWYLPKASQQAVTIRALEAGARADAAAPFAWLRMEPPNMDFAEIRMRLFPDGEDRLLGRSHHHGRWVEWGTPS